MAAQNIVIVGGGGAGVAIARDLASKLPKVSPQYKITLVTSRESYVHLPAALRMVVSPKDKLEESAIIPYDSVFSSDVGSVKIGTVTSVSSGSAGNEVVLDCPF